MTPRLEPPRHSAIYEGWVRHRRHAPVGNAFRYRLSMLYLDLAELPRLSRRGGLWSVGRRNLAWFRRADYLGDARVPLDTAVRDLVEAQLGRRPSGPIRMLTQVRTFGYVFNPVSFYYCFDATGVRVETIVTDITNTPWMERCAYVLGAEADEGHGRRRRYRFAKAFHVSPFMRMAQDYDWRFLDPGDVLWVHMESIQDGRRVLDATLALRRRAWSGRALAGVLLRHPFLTYKVTAAIYWQALRLWWKRCPFIAHPRRTGGPDHERAHAPHRSQHAASASGTATRPQPGPRAPAPPDRRQPAGT